MTRHCRLTQNLLLLALAAAVSAPLFFRGLFLPNPGHDLLFHLQRIAGLASAIQAGQFPVQIQSWWIRGMGYAVSAFYPDLFLYPSALLYLCGLSLENAYKLLVLGINIASCWIAFYSFRRISGRNSAAWIATVLLILAPYRLTDLYLRNAVGESLAFCFLPACAEGLFSIYRSGGKERGAWMRMGLAYAGLCCSHPLSLFMVLLFTAVYCLLRFRETFRWPVLSGILKAAGTAVLLSLWFLVPLADFSAHNALYGSQMYRAVYQEAVYEWQLFVFFSPVRGASQWLSSGTAGEMPYDIGWALLAGFVLLPFVSRRRQPAQRSWHVWLLALLAMWMCTRLFPYEQLQQIPLTDYFITKVQYPWRFEMEAALFLSLCALAFSCRLDRKWLAIYGSAVIALACVQGWMHLTSLMQNASTVSVLSAADLDSTNYMGGEFLPAEFSEAQLKTAPTQPDAGAAEILAYEKQGTEITLMVQNLTDSEQDITLPLVYYQEYTAEDTNTGTALPIENLGSGRLSVRLPAGYQGTVRVFYQAKISDWLAIAGSLAALVFLGRKKLH